MMRYLHITIVNIELINFGAVLDNAIKCYKEKYEEESIKQKDSR
jgi:hypothetical protein